jgi:N-methylhydantoinase B
MAPVDPVELELMRNLFEAAAEQMGIVLQRVSFSANIKERRDFSCALFDTTGELLAQAAHIPVHLGSMPASVAAVLDRLHRLDEGDVAIVNDPFSGGTHLPDITLVSPIYHDGRLIGYAANRAHHADVGGLSPGSMTLSKHIDEEGIRIEPALLYRAGQRDEALLKRILDAVRTPDERLGDLEAQLASNYVGADAMRKMVADYGIEHVQAYGRALQDYSQAFMSRLIDAMPDGRWSFEDEMDGGVRIAATLTIRGDRAIVDLSGSADQLPDCINCPLAVTRSAVYYCFGCLLDDTVSPNGGCFRNIDVITRPGSIVHALYPGAVVAGNTETSQRIVDVVFGLLAQVLPDRVPAASCGTMSSVAIGGTGWTYYETVGGGCGAGPGWHGESAVQCHMTNTRNTPAEAIEMQYPLRVAVFEVVENGGAGRFRGGGGIRRVIEALEPCTGTILSDRRIAQPWGLAGGSSGAAGRNTLAAGAHAHPLAGKCQITLGANHRIEIITPGGGGWGSPHP